MINYLIHFVSCERPWTGGKRAAPKERERELQSLAMQRPVMVHATDWCEIRCERLHRPARWATLAARQELMRLRRAWRCGEKSVLHDQLDALDILRIFDRAANDLRSLLVAHRRLRAVGVGPG